jgi:hypothetical protein
MKTGIFKLAAPIVGLGLMAIYEVSDGKRGEANSEESVCVPYHGECVSVRAFDVMVPPSMQLVH